MEGGQCEEVNAEFLRKAPKGARFERRSGAGVGRGLDGPEGRARVVVVVVGGPVSICVWGGHIQ